jgi:hypothetical protein
MTTFRREATVKAIPLQKVMVVLCLVVIALQAADALSTYLVLKTGQAQENNELLVRAAQLFGLSIEWIVVVSKVAVAAVFGVAMSRTKAKFSTVMALLALVCFYFYIVATNFYWAHVFA